MFKICKHFFWLSVFSMDNILDCTFAYEKFIFYKRHRVQNKCVINRICQQILVRAFDHNAELDIDL